MSQRKLSRREFSAEAVMTMLAGVAVTVTGGSCGSSGSSPSAPTTTSSAPAADPPPPDAVEGEISANHGHVARITNAQLQAGDAITLDISGNAGHPHSVQLTADEVEAIANGAQVRQRSSTIISDNREYPDVETHSHLVTFN